MAIYHRPYSPDSLDFEKMWRLLEEDYARRRDQFIWLISRFSDWKYGCWSDVKLFPMFHRRNGHLWLDSFEQVNGFVLSENDDNIFFIVTRRGYDHLYAEILAWTVAHWGPRFPSLVAEVNEGQADALAGLPEQGFAPLGHVATTRAYLVAEQAACDYVLPEGFRAVSIAEEPDYYGKKLLQRNGFQGKNDVRDLDLLAFEYSREANTYDPYLDVSIVGPNGQHVAACVGFIDPCNNISEIERVCTHSDHRQRGFAYAAIRECFRRLHRRGFERAYITSYGLEANNLYEKLGPVNRTKWLRYELHTK